MRYCPKCEQDLPLSEFSLFLKRGKMLPRVHCKPCRVLIERERVLRKRGVDVVPTQSRGLEERAARAAFLQWQGGEPRQDWRVRL